METINKLAAPNNYYMLPTSFGQERIWFFEQTFPESATYNIPFVLKINGVVNAVTIKNTLLKIIEKHEVLRTTLCEYEGETLQKVSLDSSSISFIFKTKAEIEEQCDFDKYLENFAATPFKIEKEFLIRFELVQLELDRYYLLVNVHHLMFDAWSIDVLVNELLEIYPIVEAGRIQDIKELELQYADFANWEKERLNGEFLQEKILFWKEYLQEAPSLLELPTDYIRPLNQSYAGNNIKFKIPENLLNLSRKYASSNGSTMYSFYLSAFNVLLYKLTGQKDIVIGTPVANRHETFTQDLIGFFVNTLVLRTPIKPYSNFKKLLKFTMKNFIQAYEQSEVPFERIVQEINPERDSSAHPIFQVLFTFQEKINKHTFETLEIEPERIKTSTSKFDLALYIGCDQEEGYGEIEYNSDLFKKETINHFIELFLNLLNEILNKPEKSISKIDILSEIERGQLLSYNKITYPTEKLVHQVFEEIAKKNPFNIAIGASTKSWTYKEVNEQSNKIANHLISLGVKPHSIVGINMKRSKDQIASILGVLKAGCSYLPLDPTNPINRTSYVLTDSKAVILIGEESNMPKDFEIPIIFKNDYEHQTTNNPNLLLHHPLDQIGAYTIYTSGTTGNPKGLTISHSSLLNHLYAYMEKYSFYRPERILQNVNFTFDASITEIFSPLLTGNTLVLSDPDKQFDVDYLAKLMKKERITRAQLFHSLIENLLEIPDFVNNDSMRYIFTGGEALSAPLIKRYYSSMATNAPLINLYGPTEATVAATYYECESDIRTPIAPIGKPFSNYQLVVLDQYYNVVPTGVVGELFIGGPGLSNGYLNEPTLNEKNFHFLDLNEDGNKKRFYQTGDLVKRLESGDFMFISRRDTQVKIRGFRIEIGEIKQVLLNIPEVKESAVVVKEVNGEKRLFAFIVKNPHTKVSLKKIKEHLSNVLPHYMIPSFFMFIEEIPLSKHGKLVERNLPFDTASKFIGEKRFATNPLEDELTALWKQVLSLSELGVNEDFFDLGGHSVKVIEIVGYVRKKMNIAIPVSALFHYRTIESLAIYISEFKSDCTSSIIVPLKQSKSVDPPLFLIHPGGGGAMCYIPLAKYLELDISIYGIQSVGYDQEVEPLTSVKDMAQKYVSEIKKIQNKGPYRLAGWSMGGTIALEIARIFEQESEEVSFIGLLDAHAFDTKLQLNANRDPLFVWAESLHINIKDFELLTISEKYQTILSAVKHKRILPESSDVEDVRRVLRIMASNNLASDNYNFTKPIHSNLTIFCCTEKDPNQFHDLVDPSSWKKRTEGDVETIHIPGNHSNLMNSPYVENLGENFTTLLKRGISNEKRTDWQNY